MRSSHGRRGPAALLPLGLGLLLAAACTTTPPSRKWIVPPTHEAEACVADCAESRRLCVRRPTRADVVPDRTRDDYHDYLGYSEDVDRQQRCDAVYEDCVGLCPGVTRR